MSILTAGQQYARVRAGAWNLDLSENVLADLTISHGRQDYTFGAAALSTSTFTVAVPRGQGHYWPVGEVGNPVTVDTGIGPDPDQPFNDAWADFFHGVASAPNPIWHTRHTGHITNIDYDWTVDGGQWWMHYKITTVGRMAQLGSRLLTGTTWPAETARTRAANILTATWGAHYVQGGDYNPNLTGAERDLTRPALQELEDLSGPAEAILWDDCNGNVVWQELAHRKTTQTVDLPACAVQFAPGFSTAIDLVNDLYLEYGTDNPKATVHAWNDDSRYFLGFWSERYDTPYADQTSAQIKADRVVRRQAFPTIRMPQVTVLLNELLPAQWLAVRSLRVGDKVRLPMLPDPFPMNNVGQAPVMVVEGWTEHVGTRATTGGQTKDWTLTLSLSPPLWSIISRTWNEMGGVWNDYPNTTWDQIGELT